MVDEILMRGVTPIAMPQPVRAPAYSVRAERENEVLVAKAPEKAEASLPAPCPTRSWFASQRLRSRWFSILALARDVSHR